jgi:predicted homoserine dehydrogenase-like protein
VNGNVRLRRDVKKGELITYDDVTADESSLVWRLRREQDGMFG